MNFLKSLKQLTEPKLVWKSKSYSLKICYFPVNYFIVLLSTKYLFIVMQINEYDITNEIGEHSYRRGY